VTYLLNNILLTTFKRIFLENSYFLFLEVNLLNYQFLFHIQQQFFHVCFIIIDTVFQVTDNEFLKHYAQLKFYAFTNLNY